MGSLDANIITRILRTRQKQIRYCYEREVAGGFKGTGRVIPRFIISPTGVVKNVAIQSSTLNNSKVEGCISKVIQRMNFPQTPGGGIVIVRQPYIFSLNP